MSNELNKHKRFKEIADELAPASEEVNVLLKDELLNKLTLAFVLTAIAPSKNQSIEATKLAEEIIEMGLTAEEIETCKRRALGRLDSGSNPLAGLDKAF